MKSLTETLNETLENSLQLEIAKLADGKSEDKQKDVLENSNSYSNASHICPSYKNYKVALNEKLFNGTYEEYLKLGIVFGATSPVGHKIE